MRVAVLRKEIAQRGNSVEFPESIIIEGQYGDRAGTTPLSDETYVMLTNRVKELKLK